MAKKKLRLQELTDKDEEILEKLEEIQKPKTIKTGLKSWEGATKLEIFYHKKYTYVWPLGEEYNAEPWKFKGHISPKAVKVEYLDAMREE